MQCALDGRIEGRSYRAIVEGLFGTNHIPKRARKTHELRNWTIRLVQSGFALMRGGYCETAAAIAPQEVAHSSRGVSKIHPLIFGIPLRVSAPPS
jgi:Uncharacterized conserved protein (DUF2285)